VYSAVASRVSLRAASWIVPPSSRAEWLQRWDANLAGWRVLWERGELARSDSSRLFHLYRESVREAFSLRTRSEAAQAVLHGPGFVVSVGLALLLLAAVATHGFRGARSFFEPVPVNNPEALVSIQYPTRPNERAAALARLIPFWQEKSALARNVAGYRYAYNASGAWVTWNFFAVLGTRPAAGRLFQPSDRDAVLLSYPAWRSIYRSNPRIVGSTIRVDGRAYKVIGILPELFWALSPAIDVWAPLIPETQPARPAFLSGAVGRLPPGLSDAQFGKELSDLAKAANLGQPRPVRIVSFDDRLPGSSVYVYLLGTLFAIISGLVMVAREHRRPTGHDFRYWPFLAAKTIFAIAIPLLLWMEVEAVLRTFQPALGIAGGIARILAAPLTFVVACACGLVWTFADQRRRCPVCLRRLAMPVTVGSPASVFEPVLTELVCPNGHGALSLPEDETDRPDRWIALDSSWDELFNRKSARSR
jgi:hypothetical protein